MTTFNLFLGTLLLFGTVLIYHSSWKGEVKPINSHDITETLINNIQWENIRDNLRNFTIEPHPAGTSANNRVSKSIADIWHKNGLQDVHFVEYNVLLSYPNYTDPNHITIFNFETEEVIFESTGISPVILSDEQGAPGAGIQWLAYSANGTVEADVVYCHYGTSNDFKRLKQMGVSVKDKIALMRYNTEFRGAKIMNAQLNGAVGAILYTDPMEFASEGTDHVYPNTVYMPAGGVQRGSIMNMNGDPLTPLYPSRNDLFPSRTIDEAKEDKVLPSIPALPVSYSDAYQILSQLQGNAVPAEWQGSLNITYKLGPGFDASKKLKFRIKVNAKLEKRKIQNVVGYIYGEKEPDEYVILGNHFDAWVYGAVDPNSGTATLAEVARAFVQTIKETGWRPARTIVFCNWDAEEYGLIGSTEFVEEFANILSNRAIVYLNVDLIPGNVTLNADSVPTLYDAMVEAAKRIPNPSKVEKDLGRATVYDTWVHADPGDTTWLPNYPKIRIPGGGSDHLSFLTYLGVPVVNLRYANKSDSYPLYHSLYETHFLNEKLADPDNLAFHKSVGQYWAELARVYADEEILPLNVTTFARKILVEYVADLKKAFGPIRSGQHQHSIIKPAVKQLSLLIQNCQEFLEIAKEFEEDVRLFKLQTNRHNKIEGLDKAERRNFHMTAAQINQRLKAVDRCFVNPRGLPNAPQNRHVLFSESNKNAYASNILVAVYDELENFKNARTAEMKRIAGRRLAEEISTIQSSIQCSISTLNHFI